MVPSSVKSFVVFSLLPLLTALPMLLLPQASLEACLVASKFVLVVAEVDHLHELPGRLVAGFLVVVYCSLIVIVYSFVLLLCIGR